MKTHLILGRGFNRLAGSQENSALAKPAGSTTLSTEKTYCKEVTFYNTLVENTSGLRKELSVNSGLSLSINHIDNSINTAVASIDHISDNDLFYVIRAFVVHRKEMLVGDAELNLNKAVLLKDIENIDKFLMQYGDSYIDQIAYGKEITAVMHFHCHSQVQKRDLQLKLTTAVPFQVVDAKLNVDTKFTKTLTENKVDSKIYLRSRGLEYTLPGTVKTLEEVSNIINIISKNLMDNQSQLAAPATPTTTPVIPAAVTPISEAQLYFITKPYARTICNNHLYITNMQLLEDQMQKGEAILEKIAESLDMVDYYLRCFAFVDGNEFVPDAAKDNLHIAQRTVQDNMQCYHSQLLSLAAEVKIGKIFVEERLNWIIKELNKYRKYSRKNITPLSQNIEDLAGVLLVKRQEFANGIRPNKRGCYHSELFHMPLPPDTQSLRFIIEKTNTREPWYAEADAAVAVVAFTQAKTNAENLARKLITFARDKAEDKAIKKLKTALASYVKAELLVAALENANKNPSQVIQAIMQRLLINFTHVVANGILKSINTAINGLTLTQAVKAAKTDRARGAMKHAEQAAVDAISAYDAAVLAYNQVNGISNTPASLKDLLNAIDAAMPEAMKVKQEAAKVAFDAAVANDYYDAALEAATCVFPISEVEALDDAVDRGASQYAITSSTIPTITVAQTAATLPPTPFYGNGEVKFKAEVNVSGRIDQRDVCTHLEKDQPNPVEKTAMASESLLTDPPLKLSANRSAFYFKIRKYGAHSDKAAYAGAPAFFKIQDVDSPAGVKIDVYATKEVHLPPKISPFK